MSACYTGRQHFGEKSHIRGWGHGEVAQSKIDGANDVYARSEILRNQENLRVVARNWRKYLGTPCSSQRVGSRRPMHEPEGLDQGLESPHHFFFLTSRWLGILAWPVHRNVGGKAVAIK